MSNKLPAWTQPILFATLTTGVASFMVAGISTLRAMGPGPGFVAGWLGAWLWSWPIAAVTMYFVAPYVRRWLTFVCEAK